MGFAKKKKKILKPSQQNKISLTFPLLSYIYIPTSKKKQRKKQRILHSQSPIPSQFEKKKRIFENNILRKRRWFLLSKYKKKRKNLSHNPLPLKYVSQRTSQLRVTNHRVPILFDPSSPLLPDLRAPLPISLLLRYYRAYTSVEGITHETAFDQPSVPPSLIITNVRVGRGINRFNTIPRTPGWTDAV